MVRKIITGLLIFVCFLLQSTVFRALDFGGIAPNLLIILTASFGFMSGRKSGMCIGFFCGLLVDVMYGDVIGLHALIYMYIGYINGMFMRVFYPGDIRMPLALIVASDFVFNMSCYILLFLFRSRFAFGFYLTNVIFPEMVYTLVVTFLLYPVLLFVNRKLEEVPEG